MIKVPDFFEDAACRGMPTSIFFPPHKSQRAPAHKKNHTIWTAARNICDPCKVQQECRNWATFKEYQSHGYWGSAPIERKRAVKSGGFKD